MPTENSKLPFDSATMTGGEELLSFFREIKETQNKFDECSEELKRLRKDQNEISDELNALKSETAFCYTTRVRKELKAQIPQDTAEVYKEELSYCFEKGFSSQPQLVVSQPLPKYFPQKKDIWGLIVDIVLFLLAMAVLVFLIGAIVDSARRDDVFYFVIALMILGVAAIPLYWICGMLVNFAANPFELASNIYSTFKNRRKIKEENKKVLEKNERIAHFCREEYPNLKQKYDALITEETERARIEFEEKRLPKINKRKQDLTDKLQNYDNCIETQNTKKQALIKYEGELANILPQKFWPDIDRLIGIVEDKRASTLSDAINLLISDNNASNLVAAQLVTAAVGYKATLLQEQQLAQEAEQERQRERDQRYAQDEAQKRARFRCRSCANFGHCKIASQAPENCGGFIPD